MKVSDRSVDDFLQGIDDDRRADMVALDALISRNLPDQSRVLWEGTFWGGTEQAIIGYGDMFQPRPKGETVHWFVVGLALQKANISIYVNAVKDGQYLSKVYDQKLGKVKIGSASIGFKRLVDLDVDELSALLTEIRELTSS